MYTRTAACTASTCYTKTSLNDNVLPCLALKSCGVETASPRNGHYSTDAAPRSGNHSRAPAGVHWLVTACCWVSCPCRPSACGPIIHAKIGSAIFSVLWSPLRSSLRLTVVTVSHGDFVDHQEFPSTLNLHRAYPGESCSALVHRAKLNRGSQVAREREFANS